MNESHKASQVAMENRNVPEFEYGTPIFLPEGITVSDLRSELPNSSQLLVTFVSIDQKSDFTVIEFSVRGTRYQLFPNVTYIVGVGGDSQGMLYLNPLAETTTVPTESNIPISADKQFSTAEIRKKIGVEIQVSSPDASITDALNHINSFREWQHFQTEYQTALETIGAESVRLCIKNSIEKSGLSILQPGSGMDTLLPEIILYTCSELFTDARRSGKEQIEILDLIDAVAERFFVWIKETVLPAVDELRSKVTLPSTIGFRFMEYAFDSSDLERTSVLVITYIPKVGWSISLPNANCPNQAANALTNWMSGQINRANFPQLDSSIKLAIEAKNLQIDIESQILIYNQLDVLRANYAVFHGDDTIEHAVETLKGMGDPIIGEVLFNFKQIIFLDASEHESQPVEKIKIDFGDDT